MIEITVEGPGGNINVPMELIKRALEDYGIKVQVVNDHLNKDIEGMLEIIKERIDSGYIKEYKVKLIADHIPWGG